MIHDYPYAEIITAPAGGGKTAYAIDEILATRARDPFAPVWVLLASNQQRHAFQERLIHRAGNVVFGVEMFTFEELYARVLDLLGDPQRTVDDTARHHILRHIIAAQRESLELYGEIALLPGFIRLLAGLLHELKQGMVDPVAFTRVAAGRGPKDRDLARLYVAYQQFLQDHRLIDRHGAGWLAVEHVRHMNADGDTLPVEIALLVVDGFDQLNAVNAALVTELARGAAVVRALVTLTEPGRVSKPAPTPSNTAPRSGSGRVFRRFAQMREMLFRAGAHGEAQIWTERALDVAPQSSRPPALAHLTASLFDSRAPSIAGDDSLALIEAPDVGREVGAVLRAVKRRLLAGESPDSIAVITRDLSLYSGALRETARAYGVPLVVRAGLRVRENPAVALVLALLDLSAADFPRRALLDALRSPYIRPLALDLDDIAWLERISMARQVIGGRAAWLRAVRGAGRPLSDEDRETRDLLDEAGAAALAERLAAFFKRLTPPDSGTVYDFTRWIEDLLGPDPVAESQDRAEGDGDAVGAGDSLDAAESLRLIACIRDTHDQAAITRDLNAITAFKRALHQLRAAHDLLAGGGALRPLSWSEFRKELQLAIERLTMIPAGGFSRLGRVLATSVHEARGLPHDHVFVLGLAEGVFPAQERDTALYQESERRDLEQQHDIDMLTAHERIDDVSLFYQAVGLARRSLTLSRYTFDDKGAEVPASPYWRAVCGVVDVPPEQIVHVRVGAVPALESAAALSEAAVAVAALWSGEHPPGAWDPAAVHNALLDDARTPPAWTARWCAILHGRAVEARRDDPAQPFDHFDGLIADPGLRAWVAETLGPDRVWSASQLNEYGICPFRFFARRLLRLDELKEPDEGLDQLQLGLINHAILENTYARIAGEGFAIAPENQGRALDILRAEADAVFATAPGEYGFAESAIWWAERSALLRRLEWLVRADFSDDSPFDSRAMRPVVAALDDAPRVPYHQEATFGFNDTPPLNLHPGGAPLWVRGAIDRLDRVGDAVIVIDYKTGTTPHPVRDMQRGRDFQMMVYLLAAEILLAQQDPDRGVAGGLFWHIRNRKTSGEIAAHDSTIPEARDTALHNVALARDARFIVQPNSGVCAPYCEFRKLCRLSRANHAKTDWEM